MAQQSQTLPLQGKVAIITGGGQGFGEGIVTSFVRDGAKVIMIDLNGERAKAKAKELGCDFVQGDVTLQETWESALEMAISKHGKLDAVVNNAGWSYNAKSSVEVSEADFDKVFSINVKSLWAFATIIIPFWKRQGTGGSVTTISSASALRPRPNLCWYNATKGAASLTAKSWAVEFASDQIRSNTVCPVAGNTPLLENFVGGVKVTEESVKHLAQTIPMGRLATPRDIGDACAFLASDNATFITGVDLPVDGGRCV